MKVQLRSNIAIVGILYILYTTLEVIEAKSTPVSATAAPVAHFTSCSKGKRLPHPENPSKYFQCQFISKADVWLTQPFNCLSEHVFDEPKQLCVRKNSNTIVGRTQARSDIPPATTIPTIQKRIEAETATPIHEPIQKNTADVDQTSNSNTEAFGLIAKLASTIESLASTVQTLAKTNENIYKSTLNANSGKIGLWNSEHFDRLDESWHGNSIAENHIAEDDFQNLVHNDLIPNVHVPVPTSTSTTTTTLNPVDENEITQGAPTPTTTDSYNIFIHNQNAHEELEVPALVAEHAPAQSDVAGNKESEEDSGENPENSSEQNEGSILKKFLQNFLPRPKLGSFPFPRPPSAPFLHRTDDMMRKESKIMSTTTTITPNVIHQETSPTIPAKPNNDPESSPNFINLISLFKRLSGGYESNEESQPQQKQQHLSPPFTYPHRTRNPNPLIFQRIPMSSSPSNSRHSWPFLQHSPQIINPDNDNDSIETKSVNPRSPRLRQDSVKH